MFIKEQLHSIDLRLNRTDLINLGAWGSQRYKSIKRLCLHLDNEKILANECRDVRSCVTRSGANCNAVSVSWLYLVSDTSMIRAPRVLMIHTAMCELNMQIETKWGCNENIILGFGETASSEAEHTQTRIMTFFHRFSNILIECLEDLFYRWAVITPHITWGLSLQMGEAGYEAPISRHPDLHHSNCPLFSRLPCLQVQV